jgi:hypothetical protein
LCEAELVSEEYQYGGTIDLYCEFTNGQKWLVDHKTCKGLYSNHGFQLAAYRNLLTENGHKVDGCRILRIGRNEDEGFEERTYGMMDLNFEVFKSCLDIYTNFKAIKKGGQ